MFCFKCFSLFFHIVQCMFLYLDTIKHSFYHNLRSADFVFERTKVFVVNGIRFLFSLNDIRSFNINEKIIFSPFTADLPLVQN